MRKILIAVMAVAMSSGCDTFGPPPTPDDLEISIARIWNEVLLEGIRNGFARPTVPANEFLVFEDAPSVEITFERATYVDASDQCSLSRIWGGIHPPADDIPGRLIGIELGPRALNHARDFFLGESP